MYEKATVNGSHGVYIVDAKYVEQLEQRLKEAESILIKNAMTKSYSDAIKCVVESQNYLEKYKGDNNG